MTPVWLAGALASIAGLGTSGRALFGRRLTTTADRASPRADRHFAAAIDNLSQGIVILDRDLRLVVGNRRLYDLFPRTGAAFPPGTPMAEIIACKVAAGHHPGQTTEQLVRLMRERFASGTSFTYQIKLAGGRLFEARWNRLPDDGWVGTYQDIAEQQWSIARIEHMAHHDGLTDLVNRAGFHEAVGRAIARAHRGEDIAVLAINLDRFQPVNDQFGHAAGDGVLREVAVRLKRAVREADVVARLGGDEFAVVQSGVNKPEAAATLARRLAEALAHPYTIEAANAGAESAGAAGIVIGVSIGIALGNLGDDAPEDLLRNAMLALQRAKSETPRPAGTATYCFFEAEMKARASRRRVLEADLRQALPRGEFELFYQPLVSIRERRVCAFEALIRWRHPDRGLVTPDDFIPLAEETGLIVPIGAWVLRTACAEAQRWQDPQGRPPRVAVNLSAVQFTSPDLAETVRDALAASGLAGDRLELEITESVLLHDNEATLRTLNRLHDLGARISMDDFGTGYSSLSYLGRFPFDKLKIDKSFIHGMTLSDGNDVIVRAIAGLGLSLGIATTAEGVETLEQLERLIANGCTEVQGYFFSPPRPASDIPALILAVQARHAA